MAKMAVCSSLTTTTTHFSCCNSRCLCPTISSSLSSSFLPLLNLPQQRLRLRPLPLYSLSLQPRTTRTRTRNRTITITRAFGTNNNKNNKKDSSSNSTKQQQDQDEEEEEEEFEQVEEDLPWIQEKALDFVEFTGSVTQAIPGPRVAHTSLPWFLAVPLAFLGLTFVTSFVKTVNKFTSPKAQRRKLISKNAMLNKTIDELFEKGRDAVQYSAFEDIVKKTGFGMEDVLRKYLRYAFNDKPFNGDTVADLIQLRKASMLTDSQVAEILNDISRRIVKDKGPVVMDASGYTERGFKRKLAVQALFGKVFYLSELPEFCSRDSSLIVKEIFGVTDEDAEKLRIHSLSNPGDIEALEWMIEDGSDSEGKDES